MFPRSSSATKKSRKDYQGLLVLSIRMGVDSEFCQVNAGLS
ncbi:hypothetical protein D3OALGA1CA_2612 [Olavius algarvensis associated proteobacterium Delta 3]|nr:hypothetical protein D3OALGA1CA_2612 [Olavius algarvensis associated proteobacterium Delta 3]